MTRSLRKQLLAWVLVPLVCSVGVDGWLTYQSARDTATVVQDRLLLGSARMIAEQISFEDGTFQHQIPPAALELFQPQEIDHIYYRVTTGAGQLLAGYTDLGVPKTPANASEPFYFSTTARGESVRGVAFFQPVIGNPSALPVIVEVAQTGHAREALTATLWWQAVEQQMVIVALAAVCMVFGLQRGLRPLVQLRNEVRSRMEGSLQTLHTTGIPSELKPLVDAINDYIQRLERHTKQRGIFVQNAAHQLRTPLTVLTTQISDAQQARDKLVAEAALVAARKTLQQTTHLVNQFLSLSSAEACNDPTELISSGQACLVVQEVLESLAAQAHAKQIDLGFEREGTDAEAQAAPGALREIAFNVIDNAIRNTPEHGVITARVRSSRGFIAFDVEDNGPGIAASQLDRIFDRFYRVDGSIQGGSGLGLAIVKELADQSGATIAVGAAPSGSPGFLFTITFGAGGKAPSGGAEAGSIKL